MKSKSFDLKKSSSDKGKANKTFDFVGLYKSAAETNVRLLEKPKTVENLDKENSYGTPANSVAKKREISSNKKKKKGKNEPLDISHINGDGQCLEGTTDKGLAGGDSRATSTPYAKRKNIVEPKVKSIMKTSLGNVDEVMSSSTSNTPVSKPKKRNKSVSFMLDDADEVATKKTKSDESILVVKKKDKLKTKVKSYDKKKLKHLKKDLQAEKENKASDNMETDQAAEVSEKKIKKDKSKTVTDGAGDSSASPPANPERKKKHRKDKKHKKTEDNTEQNENDSNNNEETEQKHKKPKKKKRAKCTETIEGEPASKVKKEVKPEVIAEDLENLSIGDNAHTLTNLLDEMTVVDKDKKKKSKLRRKKDKMKKSESISSSETADLEKIEEGKEKIKWKNRKWNKDKKGDANEDLLATSVIVENLPLKIMCSYKKLLADHFGPMGTIKKIGVAEVYPTEDSKPVFTTTVNFDNEAAASKALEEDNTPFEGSRIRIKRPLPPTETTLVVRSYADLNEQNISSVFTTAGRIRRIRLLIKGKKSMATAFVEFDGPKAVERAIKMAEDAKIGAKKLHVSKFELRGARRKENKKSNADSENEGDSEDSES